MDRKLAKARTEAGYSLDWYHRATTREQAGHRYYAKRMWHRANRRFERIVIDSELGMME